VQRSVDDRLSAFQPHHFTTNGAETQILVRKAQYGIVGRPPQANTGKYREKQLMKDTYPASEVNAEGNNDLLRSSTNESD
jgi:hypothetical protein